MAVLDAELNHRLVPSHQLVPDQVYRYIKALIIGYTKINSN